MNWKWSQDSDLVKIIVLLGIVILMVVIGLIQHWIFSS